MCRRMWVRQCLRIVNKGGSESKARREEARREEYAEQRLLLHTYKAN
ncbi:MAG: hypothetical protein ACQESR_12060 [Planctomycetota bacterium]